MSYARNLLSRGEEVVFETRQHWFAIMARTWIWLLAALLAVTLLIWAADPGNTGTAFDILTIVALVALIVAAARVGWVLWDWRNQEWLITTRRVIRAEGVINKRMFDSSLEKINDARLNQSFVGRIFGYGTLDILTAAEELSADGVADFPMVADPIEFKVAMLNQKELLERPDLAPPRYQRSATPPEMRPAEPMPPRAGSSRVSEVHAGEEPGPAVAAAPPPVPTPSPQSAPGELADTLERLGGLRDKGLITDDEYETKKREILERM